MSYIKVLLGGKERGLKFNQLAVEVFSKHVNLEAIETSAVYATFYGGLMGNSYAKKEEVDFNFEDVIDWVDALYDAGETEVIKSVNDAFAETQSFKSFIKRIEESVDESKKK